MRSGTYVRAEKAIHNFTGKTQKEKATSLEEVLFPVSVPRHIEVVRWE
jgi:hypothetical protein